MSNGNTNTLLRDPDGDALSVNALPADLFAAVSDAFPDGIYAFDQHGRLTTANRIGTLLQDRNAGPLIGKSCCEMFWREPGSENCVVDRALKTGERVVVEILTGDTFRKPIRVIVQPSPREQSGMLSAIVIATDISEVRRAEADALAQRSFMANIADRSPDEIYALDKDGRITWMNERGEADNYFMLSGRYFVEFIAEESRDLAANSLKRALLGEEIEYEMRATRVDGAVRQVEAHTSPLWKDNDVTGVLVFLRDVTERRRTQELAAQSDKLRAVGELAAGVAHNINNSLTVIQGRAQLLMMRTSDEAVVKSLKIITNAVEEGAQTLRRILDFARRESAREFSPVDLADLLVSSIEIARPKWQSKGAKSQVEVKMVCDEPVWVLGELAELREVVLNLLFNAVDAMPEGGIMEVGARAELDSGCFWVADTGTGIAPQVSARIFEPFFTTKGKNGTGLGLSASHGIITRHNGKIVVASEPGQGTRFEVMLPTCEKGSHFIKNSGSRDTETSDAERETVASA